MANIKRCAESILSGYHPAQGGWHQLCARLSGEGSAYCWQHQKRKRRPQKRKRA